MMEGNKQLKHSIHVEKGDILHGRYLVLSHIASGGMSEVFLIEERENPENRWAVKVATRTHPLAKKLEREAKILSTLDHPTLPYVVDFFQDKDYYFLVMEYVHGVSLYDYLAIHNHHLAVDRIIEIGKALCDIIAYLHSQKPHPIIYRDIKPGNILIKNDGTIKLIDFGTARTYQEKNRKDTVRIGTVGFAAPEQFEHKQTDERTDLFSLGALFYYLLSEGKYVYIRQQPIKKLNKTIPRSLEKCVNKLVKLTPEKRLQSIQEVKAMLEKAEKEQAKRTSKQSGFHFNFLTIFNKIGGKTNE